MKRLFLILAVAVSASLMLNSCTENERARSFGGTMTIELPEGQDFVNATWKETTLWYVTTPRPENGTIETYTFQEKSAYGAIEGTVVFIEQ